ncbi:hypothetical protein ACP4OV_015540 [Aristida adscensionis]
MENVLLDRSTGSFELPRRALGGGRRGLGARPAMPRRAGAYNHSSFPATSPQQQQYYHLHNGGAWSSAPALPYALPPPAIYSSPSLPLLPSNQPPLLPLPPTAAKYATFPCLPPGPTPPPPPPPPRAGKGGAAAATTVPAAAAPAAPRQRDRRRKPARPPPPPPPTEPAKAQTAKKKPLERAAPLPPAPVVNAALDDLEQEVARSFVQDLLHALAPPPSSLPLPRFSLVVKASAGRVVAPPAPSCNAEAAAAADAIRGLLRL